ncbi:hypothetical protein SAMN04490204_5241 [Pseudomonas thivervalensis]|nr:hypothetical protein SAMN04490204_5241 [Pseudomonas thivervalensis]
MTGITLFLQATNLAWTKQIKSPKGKLHLGLF